MSPQPEFDEARVRRSSRHSAWITLFGALVVGGAFLFSLVKLSDINQEYETKQALANAEQRRADSLKDVAASMQKQIEVLRGNARELEQSYASLHTVVAASNSPQLKMAYSKNLPLITVVKPRATAVPSKTGRASVPLYDFSLWVDVPENRKSEIVSVEYEFNHPTFRQKTQQSSNAEDGFKVSYSGWGCLRSVLVRIHLRQGGVQTIDFDMCEAVGFELSETKE